MNPISKTLIVSLSWAIVMFVVLDFCASPSEAIVVAFYPLWTTPVVALISFLAFSLCKRRWVQENVWTFVVCLVVILLLIVPSFPKGFYILFDTFFKFKLL